MEMEEQTTIKSESKGHPKLHTYQATDQNGSPPSYDSIFGKAKAMREKSNGNVDFVKKVIFTIFGTIGFTIFLGIFLAIPISMIAMGAVHLDDCPEERYIPIYLVVFGSFGLVRNLFTIGRRCYSCAKKKDEEEGGEDEQNNQSRPNPFESLLDTFMFAWFIAGNVWIYRTYGDWSSDRNAVNYCDASLYWYAFWITTSVYILIGCCCCCCCFCGIMACCLAAKASKNAENAA